MGPLGGTAPAHAPQSMKGLSLPFSDLSSSLVCALQFSHEREKLLVAQSCLTLFNPMDYSLPGSIPGILQARILEWVAILFSSGPSPPGYWTWVSCTTDGFFLLSGPPGKPIIPYFPSDHHLPKDRGFLSHFYFACSWARHSHLSPSTQLQTKGKWSPSVKQKGFFSKTTTVQISSASQTGGRHLRMWEKSVQHCQTPVLTLVL